MASLGLALGGGAARGWAHLGILEALDEEGVDIDMIAGTSFGAVVGSTYCFGAHRDLLEIGKEVDYRRILSFFNLNLLNRSGLSDGSRIEEFFRKTMDIPDIEDLMIPFRAVSCDLNTGEKVVFDKGDTLFAVMASSAVPVMFTTREYEGRTLVDGGLVDPLPVDVVRDMGPDIVIGVDLNHYLPDRRARGKMIMEKEQTSILDRFEEMILIHDLKSDRMSMWDVFFNSLFLAVKQVTEKNLLTHPPDILISPDLRSINFMDFHLSGEALDIGKRAALDKMDEIRALL